MEKAAKRVLMTIAEDSPYKRVVGGSDINAWNETNDKRVRYKSTPCKKNLNVRILETQGH
jgi:hypothetical protein